jgi:hypothetical protein
MSVIYKANRSHSVPTLCRKMTTFAVPTRISSLKSPDDRFLMSFWLATLPVSVNIFGLVSSFSGTVE